MKLKVLIMSLAATRPYGLSMAHRSRPERQPRKAATLRLVEQLKLPGMLILEEVAHVRNRMRRCLCWPCCKLPPASFALQPGEPYGGNTSTLADVCMPLRYVCAVTAKVLDCITHVRSTETFTTLTFEHADLQALPRNNPAIEARMLTAP